MTVWKLIYKPNKDAWNTGPFNKHCNLLALWMINKATDAQKYFSPFGYNTHKRLCSWNKGIIGTCF